MITLQCRNCKQFTPVGNCCINCGTPISKERREPIKCGKCNFTTFDDGASFCLNCGHEFKKRG